MTTANFSSERNGTSDAGLRNDGRADAEAAAHTNEDQTLPGLRNPDVCRVDYLREYGVLTGQFEIGGDLLTESHLIDAGYVLHEERRRQYAPHDFDELLV